MNFLSLNHFLKKKKNWINQRLTHGGLRLAEATESLAGGPDQRSTLTGQWSTLTRP